LRDISRTRLSAAAKSRRASSRELREAQQRIKEIDAELRQIELQPETKQGEDREARYERILRLRQMRDEFESRFPIRAPRQPNSLLLAILMVVGSFLTCAFCAGGFYFGFSALNFNPGPSATTSSFWSDVSSQSYQDVYLNLLASNLRLQFVQTQFIQDAERADTDYGPVTNAVLVPQSNSQKTNSSTTATYNYTVTRQKKGGKPVTYTVTLTLSNSNNSWGITDLGAAIYPTEAGVKPVNTSTPTPKVTATKTP
jgi:hypothetical protein